jgi:hypothetical protein
MRFPQTAISLRTTPWNSPISNKRITQSTTNHLSPPSNNNQCLLHRRVMLLNRTLTLAKMSPNNPPPNPTNTHLQRGGSATTFTTKNPLICYSSPKTTSPCKYPFRHPQFTAGSSRTPSMMTDSRTAEWISLKMTYKSIPTLAAAWKPWVCMRTIAISVFIIRTVMWASSDARSEVYSE